MPYTDPHLQETPAEVTGGKLWTVTDVRGGTQRIRADRVSLGEQGELYLQDDKYQTLAIFAHGMWVGVHTGE